MKNKNKVVKWKAFVDTVGNTNDNLKDRVCVKFVELSGVSWPIIYPVINNSLRSPSADANQPVSILFVKVITWFRVQFGINKHE